MKHWLRLTSLRAVLALLLVAVGAFLASWWPVHRAKQLIVQQLAVTNQALTQLGQAQSFIVKIPAIKQSMVSSPDEVKNVADQAKQASASFNQIKIIRPAQIQPILGLSFNHSYAVIGDYNSTITRIHSRTIYTKTRNDTAQAQRLISYHAAVSEALVNLLEYDPTLDTKGFSLSSQDTQDRLAKAREGLIKTDQQLQAAKKIYQDSSIDQVSALVSGLRYDRYQLSINGDTAAWIKQVEAAQTQIAVNRFSFWAAASAGMAATLKTDQTNMQLAYSLWQQDAQKYNLS